VGWGPDVFKGSACDAYASQPSTAASGGMSHDDVRNLSQQFDDSLQMASSVGFSADPEPFVRQESEGWNVQTPANIIEEVTRLVHERKPWRQRLDDSVLDQKHNERQDRMERGFHIILPDNRVRVMEDELSFRVRCSLLDTDPEEEEPPLPPLRPDMSKFKNKKMRTNPWYLKPEKWYSLEEKLKAENDEENSNDFPYANVILNLPNEPKPNETAGAPALTPFQKENLDMYKTWMKGNRLPHFLQ